MRYYKKKEEIDKRKADVQPIGESIKALLRVYRLEGKIMGKLIAMKTQELYFRDHKLFVRLTSAPFFPSIT